MASELSDALAERYCDMLDLVREIDIEQLENKIRRLTNLRDAILAMRGQEPKARSLAAHVERSRLESRPEQQTEHRRPNGFWVRAVKETLQRIGTGSFTAIYRDLCQHEGIVPKTDGSRSIEVSIRTALTSNPSEFVYSRNGHVKTWSLKSKSEEASVA